MKRISIYLTVTLILAIILLLIPQGCKKGDESNPIPRSDLSHNRGDIILTTNIGDYSLETVKQILSDAQVPMQFTLNYGVKVLSVNYYTVDNEGNRIIASGAFFIPKKLDDMTLLSLQHGTETKRDRVASVAVGNSTESIMGLLTASIGYLTVVPDYPGFGVSEMMHPYMHAASIVPSVIDFMRSCKSYCVSNQIGLNENVFLTGYSEGGYITLVTQKEIEENHEDEFKLKGVAPLSGPYDLKGMIDSVMQSNTYASPAYVAYFLTAYNHIYKWNRLDEFFNAPYASMMPGLFNGSKKWGEVVSRLPASLSNLMNPAFVTSYNKGHETDVIAAINENTFLNWKPKAPMHFFHGDADQLVPYYHVLNAVESFSASGITDIELTTISGGTHESTGPVVSINAIHWIESLSGDS